MTSPTHFRYPKLPRKTFVQGFHQFRFHALLAGAENGGKPERHICVHAFTLRFAPRYLLFIRTHNWKSVLIETHPAATNMNTFPTRYRPAYRGFTLIELMITVAVLTIVVSVALPSYRNHIMRGKRTAAKAAMMDIASREQQYLLANRSYADKAALNYTLENEVAASYTWTLTANNAASPPTFLITFTPTGPQTDDGALTLDNIGTKSPADKWSR